LGHDADPEFRLMRFSTDQLPVRDRFEMWRHQFSQKLLRMAIDPLNDAPYRAKAALRTLPQMRIGAGSVSPAVHHRSRQIAAQENDDLVLIINMTGPYIVRREAGDLTLGDGDACLLECCEAGDYVMPAPGRHMVIRLSRSVLGAFARHVDLALGRLIPAETEALMLLSAYARSLPRGAWEYSAAVSQAVTTHVGDMVGLVVGATGEAAIIASHRGLAAARLGSIKGYIRERICDPELSAETVAAAHHISPRYLRQLFEAEDQSFSGY
jgi:hypothetical protein